MKSKIGSGPGRPKFDMVIEILMTCIVASASAFGIWSIGDIPVFGII